jgi:serine/threonine-protein kinase
VSKEDRKGAPASGRPIYESTAQLSTGGGQGKRAGRKGLGARLRGLVSGKQTSAGPARSKQIDGAVRRALPSQGERLSHWKRVGAGGMATVEVLIDRALRRKMAMKLLLPEMESELQAVQSFIREAQVTGQLDHPNIVPVYDFGETAEGRLFFTMKLLSGRTLNEIVRDLPAAPLERGALLDLLEIVLKVCDALAFAHERGVIHRDVKPENVMVGDFGQVYLVDWGIARLTKQESLTVESEVAPASSTFDKIWGDRVIGTPSYMSPEQASGGDLDERADLFSVGALLYYMLARRPPYSGSTAEALLERAKRCDFVPLREAVAGGGVPRELDRVVTRALSPQPEARQRSAVELKQDLVTFMRGGSLPRVRFDGGHEIIREGDVGEHAYIIVSGSCEVSKTIDGRRVPIRTIGVGESFGETAIMTAAPRTASVVALEDTTVERVTREELLEELGAMKPWASVFLRSLAERFQERETARD